jgi:hypothetical protein
MGGIVTAGTMAALSIGASVSANKSIAKTANANAAATAANLLQNKSVTDSQLQEKAADVNNQLGMALTDLVYQAQDASSATTVNLIERNITGQTAKKTLGNVDMKKALKTDQLVQQAESKLVDAQNEMRNAKYSYESGSMSNAINFNNTMSQQQGAFEIAASAAGAGLSGYSATKK